MFQFGVGAISQFKSELHLWPKFCERALAIPHLKTVDGALCAYMEKIVRAGGEGSGAGGDGDLTGAASSNTGPGADNPADGKAAAGSTGSSSMPNGVSSSDNKQQSRGGSAKGGSSNTGTSTADKAGSSAAGGASKSAGAGKSISSSSVGGGSLDTGENLREILSNANVAQQAASMALNDKPTQFERMTLNMTLNNETLDTAERKHAPTAAPNDAMTDKVSFLMNNLTVDNMGGKSRDLGHVVIPKYVEWFANYLVVKRAAQVGMCVGVGNCLLCRLSLLLMLVQLSQFIALAGRQQFPWQSCR